MTAIVNNTMISTFCGDSCPITFSGLEMGDKIAFEVRDSKNNQQVFETLTNVVNEDNEVTFEITPSMSNKLKVPIGEKFAIYWYGIKKIDESTGQEDTIFLGDSTSCADKYLLKVYPKKVEGLVENE